MIADALALYEFLQKNKDKYDTLSALFNIDGKRLEGSNMLSVEVKKTAHSDVWFYKVKPIEDYVFVPMPVVPCFTDYGQPVPHSNSDANLFRFIPHPVVRFESNYAPNLSVDFSVLGYKPKQLLSRLELK